jgi:ribosomal protein L7/L12
MEDLARVCLDPNTSEERLRTLAICGPDDTVNVIFESRQGHSTLYVIKIIREHLHIGLQEAMGFLDNLPQVLNQPRPVEIFGDKIPERLIGLPRDKAEQFQQNLEEYGAKTNIQERVFFHPRYSRLVAQNPALSSRLAHELMKSADHETQQHLAQNPALSIQDWLSLGRSCPRDALKNPALPLWLIEDPGILEGSLPLELVEAAFQDEEVSPALGHTLLQNQYFAREIAERAKTLPAWLDELSRNELDTIRQAVARNPNTSMETLRRLALDPNQRVKEEARANLTKHGH